MTSLHFDQAHLSTHTNTSYSRIDAHAKQSKQRDKKGRHRFLREIPIHSWVNTISLIGHHLSRPKMKKHITFSPLLLKIINISVLKRFPWTTYTQTALLQFKMLSKYFLCRLSHTCIGHVKKLDWKTCSLVKQKRFFKAPYSCSSHRIYSTVYIFENEGKIYRVTIVVL